MGGGQLVNTFFENISENNFWQIHKETDRIQDDEPFNVRQSLFQKTLMFFENISFAAVLSRYKRTYFLSLLYIKF